MSEFSKIKENERYQIIWDWKGKNVAHTATLERTAQGLYLIDPQTGRIREATTYFSEDLFLKIRMFRIDNRELCEDMLKLIMRSK